VALMRVVTTARWIFLAALLLFVATGGGRIVGSDEVSMFELDRAILHGRIDVPEGATLQGASTPRTPPARRSSRCRSRWPPGWRPTRRTWRRPGASSPNGS
jgi:hypothetical protein